MALNMLSHPILLRTSSLDDIKHAELLNTATNLSLDGIKHAQSPHTATTLSIDDMWVSRKQQNKSNQLEKLLSVCSRTSSLDGLVHQCDELLVLGAHLFTADVTPPLPSVPESVVVSAVRDDLRQTCANNVFNIDYLVVISRRSVKSVTHVLWRVSDISCQ